MAAPTGAKPAGTTKTVAAKTPAATPASRTSTATKTAPTAAKTAAPTKTAAPAKTAAPKPKPAAPTVLKKPAAADKNAKDAPRGPIKRPVADKTKVPDKDAKPTEETVVVEPPMQEAIVSTTNGHIDVVENGVSHDESPIDVNSCPIVEAQN
ncbi:hypothetical protein GE061_002097 [Apolygus lucorum]|uniref:Uncharacterized protein n=1 Tax=Apolygus lucorum TaxID=248454 RepID=A0A8S9X442_APOLU|nr:hypothetical protein GE061_002097 [Apolygus lucorum]